MEAEMGKLAALVAEELSIKQYSIDEMVRVQALLKEKLEQIEDEKEVVQSYHTISLEEPLSASLTYSSLKVYIPPSLLPSFHAPCWFNLRYLT